MLNLPAFCSGSLLSTPLIKINVVSMQVDSNTFVGLFLQRMLLALCSFFIGRVVLVLLAGRGSIALGCL